MSNHLEIPALRARVQAANEEFDFALACHEAWKPAAYDKGLHERIGRSYAGNTFLILRQALRREMLLALLRLWDKRPDAIRMGDIAKALSNRRIMDALAAEGAARWGDPGSSEFNYTKKAIGEELGKRAAEAIAIVRRYEKGGASHAAFAKLWALRCERLAHRQVQAAPIAPGGQDALDKEIEAFYEDTSKLIRLLFHVVKKTAYNPEEAADVHARYASLFWASVRSERMEGHPQFRPPPVGAVAT